MWLSAFLRKGMLAAAICFVALPAAAQNATVEDSQKQRHTGPVEQAIVGVEVTSVSTDGLKSVRRGNGLLIRCDGFVLVPTALVALTQTGKSEYGDKRTIRMVLRPGTPQEKRVECAGPPVFVEEPGYVTLKLSDYHSPAARLLLPDGFAEGQEVEVVWRPWDGGRLQPLARRKVALGMPPKDPKLRKPGRVWFAQPLDGVPAGAAVVGDDGMLVGMVPGRDASGQRPSFLDFSVLGWATNCVAPVPSSDTEFRKRGYGDMVAVSGGPMVLSPSLVDTHREMRGSRVACVAPFMLDRTEVTNAQYLAFWQSLPEEVRGDPKAKERLYPLGWSEDDPPFTPDIANFPVVGVPYEGALAYARSRGKRLPTPYEWYLAAFGPRGEGAMPDWARRYCDERTQAMNGLYERHAEYYRTHPELRWKPPPEGNGWHYEWSFGRVAPASMFELMLPWLLPGGLAEAPEAVRAANQWSKGICQEEAERLIQAWKEPLYLLAVGSRTFDKAACGAQDMVMNARELVVPPPGHAASWMELGWDWFEATTPDTRVAIPPPTHVWQTWVQRGEQSEPLILSRLIRRAYISPGLGEVMIGNNLAETVSVLMPANGWHARLGSGYVDRYPMLPAPLTDNGSATGPGTLLGQVWPYTPPDKQWPYQYAAFPLWNEMPRHFHRELGRPAPTPVVDPPAQGRRMSADGKAGAYPPMLYFLLPVGFRCAR